MAEELIDYVERLHAVVDELVAPLLERHRGRLACRLGCTGCCGDDLTVFEVEAELIRRHHGEVLASAPAPRGRCAFLDAHGACRIYPNRPYVCRTQGLPLRWLEEIAGEIVEQRDICPLNEAGEPVEALPVEDCWALGPVEHRLATIQERLDGGQGRRVALRDLFDRES